METRKAMQRLGWRFSEAIKSSDNSFKVNSNDIEALKAIDLAIQEHQRQQYEHNELFAKLYIYLFQKIIENDNTTVMDKIPRRKIYNLLKKPLENIVLDFTQSLNDSERNEVINSAGVSMKHPALCKEEELQENAVRVKEALNDPENMQKFLGDAWDYETVSEIIEIEVNQAINLFKAN